MDGIIIKTEDGGKNWKRLTPKTEFSLYHVSVAGEKGWAMGAKGRYMESSDGGNTWKLFKEKLRTKFWLRGMDFSDAQHGWIVGARGTIIHTTDGGDHWQGISGIYIQK